MRSGRLIAATIPFLLSATLAAAALANPRFENEVQYALEKLTSGTSSTVVIGGDRVTVTPLRTWKSVSGHYCREYALAVGKPGATPERTTGVRCRDGDGRWKMVR